MDAKEAIDYFKGILFIQNSGETVILSSSSIKAKAANALAISALEKVEALEAENARLREKATPKKPTKDRCYKCTCGYPLYSGKAFANKEKFCGHCGQRLDWSSDKE